MSELPRGFAARNSPLIALISILAGAMGMAPGLALYASASGGVPIAAGIMILGGYAIAQGLVAYFLGSGSAKPTIRVQFLSVSLLVVIPTLALIAAAGEPLTGVLIAALDGVLFFGLGYAAVATATAIKARTSRP